MAKRVSYVEQIAQVLGCYAGVGKTLELHREDLVKKYQALGNQIVVVNADLKGLEMAVERALKKGNLQQALQAMNSFEKKYSPQLKTENGQKIRQKTRETKPYARRNLSEKVWNYVAPRTRQNELPLTEVAEHFGMRTSPAPVYQILCSIPYLRKTKREGKVVFVRKRR